MAKCIYLLYSGISADHLLQALLVLGHPSCASQKQNNNSFLLSGFNGSTGLILQLGFGILVLRVTSSMPMRIHADVVVNPSEFIYSNELPFL